MNSPGPNIPEKPIINCWNVGNEGCTSEIVANPKRYVATTVKEKKEQISIVVLAGKQQMDLVNGRSTAFKNRQRPARSSNPD